MSNVTSAVAQPIRNRSRWTRLAALAAVLMAGVVILALVRVLGAISLSKVLAAFTAQPLHRLVVSGIFVVASYLTLTFYDVFALRTIGRHGVPYRIAALASFTSYTIGHNCGAAIFTCGLIRHRIYSGWGLAPTDIAKIAVITGLTYWLGNLFVLGFGVFLAPDAASAIDRLPLAANRLIATAAVGAIVVYFLWLCRRPRAIGRPGWQVALPDPGAAIVQIGIGTFDVVFVALAMQALLPEQPHIDALHYLVVFALAMLIGVVSYVPGSLGVFELAMFLALPQFGKEELLASLLTFRILYFVLPLILATLLLGLRECHKLTLKPHESRV